MFQFGDKSILAAALIAAQVSASPAVAESRSARINYMLNCMGCHLPNGEGAPAGGVPRMDGFIGTFLERPGGREFLVQVPGAANSALSDSDLAAVMNYLIDEFAGDSRPEKFAPYTAAEVAKLRRDVELVPTRRRLEILQPVNE